MDALMDEVESLEAILMEDVNIKRNAQSNVPEVIETTVFPLAEDPEAQQFVCVTLQVLPTANYPETSPEFKLVKPRGLDDGHLETIRKACLSKLQESLGFPVVFDLIEVVRELLTDTGNLPSGQCVVCLYGFTEGDEFTRTECFHYLHSYCLGRHLNAMRRNYQEEFDKLPAWQQKTAPAFKASCPVCRETIADDTDGLKCAMPPSELQNAPDFQLTRELRELQERMSTLFMQQKSRGAIIDVEAENCGTVISIETEEEVRRRLQRAKIAENATAAVAGDANATTIIGNNHASSSSSSSFSTESSIGNETGSGPSTTFAGIRDSLKSGAAVATTNFAPVVQPTQRNDPTNNNVHHHNRRHYRGGRRHQHHHHHRESRAERDRERYEHHHVPSHAAPAGPQSSAQQAAGGKQAKGQTACSAATR